MCRKCLTTAALAFAVSVGLCTSAEADEIVERVPFAGGELTISETADYEKVLAFGDRELNRNYSVFFEGTFEVGGEQVALFASGPGGNACGPSTLIVHKPEGKELQVETVGDDCGAPSPAVSNYAIYFVPTLKPGDSGDVISWSPWQGRKLAGRLTFTPEPNTNWGTLDIGTLTHPFDLFDNADAYAHAQQTLGEDLTDYMTSLGTSNTPEDIGKGFYASEGCVPHACGGSDGLMIVNPSGREIYYAQQRDGEVKTWPDSATWPQTAQDRLKQFGN